MSPLKENWYSSVFISLKESDHSRGWSWQSRKNLIYQRDVKRYSPKHTSVRYPQQECNSWLTCSAAPVPPGVDAGQTHGCIKNELRVENYLVTLLDTGGSVESRGVWRELYGEAHGVIFVVDSSDRQRMKEARDVLADLLKQPRVAGKPILV